MATATSQQREPLTRYLIVQRVTDSELRRILRAASNAAIREVNRLAPFDNQESAIRAAQYVAARAAIREQQRSTWERVLASIRRGADKASREALEVVQGMNRSVFRAVGGLPPDVRRLIEESWRPPGPDLLGARLAQGVPLSSRVYRNRDLAMGKVDEVINNGLALGQSAKEIAERVKRYIDPNTPGGASYAALRLARTELNTVFKATQVQMTAETPWVQGYEWNLSRSHKGNDICDEYARSGPYEAGRIPRSHPQCMCFLTFRTMPEREFKRRLLRGDFDNYAGIGRSGLRA